MLFPRVADVSSRVYVALRRYMWDILAIGTAKTYLRIAGILTYLFSSILLLIGGAFFLGLLTIALSLWLGQILGSLPLGFVIGAAVWLVILFVFYFLRHVVFTNPLLQKLYGSTVAKNHKLQKHLLNVAGEGIVPYKDQPTLKLHIKQLEKRAILDKQIITNNVREFPPSVKSDIAEKSLLLLLQFLFYRAFRKRKRRRRKR